MMMVQTLVYSRGLRMITLLPKRKDVKVGSKLSLDGEEGIWEVIKQYGTVDSTNVKRGWNNNI